MSQWLSNSNDYEGLFWFIGCVVLGGILGFAIGAGWTDFNDGGIAGAVGVSPWRQNLGHSIRASTAYQLATFQPTKWDMLWDDCIVWIIAFQRRAESKVRVVKQILLSCVVFFVSQTFTRQNLQAYARNPSHPQAFALLREAVIREPGGYIHGDLGILEPAPCGASRGLGMVRDSYYQCQSKCFPGTTQEKLDELHYFAKTNQTRKAISDEPNQFRQEEVLLRIPLSFQMTRDVALETLMTVVPAEVQNKKSLHALDDAALLVLMLAHERGVGRHSRWLPYIVSMPHVASCGYSRGIRPYVLDSMEAMRKELGVDVEGWSAELVKAAQYADRIAEGLNRDYGEYIQTPDGKTSLENIHWALCQVASRATAGDERFGHLRLVPILDLINHDVNAGGFVELSGKERLSKGDFVESKEDDAGTFVVRSLRHGRRRPLRKGQELLANYNVPMYTPLDWFVSLGFVPPERWGSWQKLDPVLPRVRRDGPFSSEEAISMDQLWKEEGTSVLQRIKETDPK
jgi:hypothetical protein